MRWVSRGATLSLGFAQQNQSGGKMREKLIEERRKVTERLAEALGTTQEKAELLVEELFFPVEAVDDLLRQAESLGVELEEPEESENWTEPFCLLSEELASLQNEEMCMPENCLLKFILGVDFCPKAKFDSLLNKLKEAEG